MDIAYRAVDRAQSNAWPAGGHSYSIIGRQAAFALDRTAAVEKGAPSLPVCAAAGEHSLRFAHCV